MTFRGGDLGRTAPGRGSGRAAAGRHGGHRPGRGGGRGRDADRWQEPGHGPGRGSRGRGQGGGGWRARASRGRPPRDEPRQRGLAGRAVRAARWAFTSTAAARLGTVGIGIMLARLLGPHGFGTYAVAYVALRVLVTLSGLGVGAAVARWPGDPREIAPTVTTLSLVTGLIVYGGCYLGAPGYAAAMGAPGATGVVRVLCVVVIVDALAASPAGLLQRQSRQDRRLIADQANVWLGVLVTAALAWAGMGAMSLALGRLAGCLAALALLLAFSPEPLRFGFRPARVRGLLRFGLPLAGSAVITFAVVNAGQFVVGRVLGVTALGYFVLASNLSGWPVTLFSQQVRTVAPTAFTRLRRDPAALRRAFVSAAGLLAAVALPVCLAISGLAVPLVGFVYGERWLPAAPALAWLAGLAVLQIAFGLSYSYFAVLAVSRVLRTLQLVWVAVLIPALAAGAMTGGIAGTAQAELAVAAGLALPWYAWALRRAGVGCLELAGRLAPPVTGAAVAWLACLAASRLLPGQLPALAAGGTMLVVVLGLLLHQLRGDTAILRRRPRKRGREEAAGPGRAGAGVAGPAPWVAGVADPAESAASGPVPGPALVPDRPVPDWLRAADGPEPAWAHAGGGRHERGPGVPPQPEPGWAGAGGRRGPGRAAVTEDRPRGWAAVAEGRDRGLAAVAEGPDRGLAAVTEGRDRGLASVAAGWNRGLAAVAEGPDRGLAAVTEGRDRGPGVPGGRYPAWTGSGTDADPGWGGDAGGPGPFRAVADTLMPPAAWPGLAARADSTGPLPLCVDVPPPGGLLGGALPPPLYRATARALGWEPRVWSGSGHPLDGGPPDDWDPDDWSPDDWDPGDWDQGGWDPGGPDLGSSYLGGWGRDPGGRDPGGRDNGGRDNGGRDNGNRDDGQRDDRSRAGPGGWRADDEGEEDWLPADWHPDRWHPAGP
ncbi:MAG: oligosaccharide flippase family protein [Gemmatimonadota bacterium]